MAHNKRIFFEDKSQKSFATEKTAEKKILAVIEDHFGEIDCFIHWFIITTPSGRFMPVIVAPEKYHQQGIWVAQAGWRVLF